MSSEQGVAFVTGGGRGLGRAIAIRLATDGYYVIVADLDEDSARVTVSMIAGANGSAEAIGLDVTDRDAVQRAIDGVVDRCSRLDVVVNNAIRLGYHPIADVDPRTLESMFAVGVMSLFWTTQAALPTFTAQRHGIIINMSSPAAFRGLPESSVYSAIKGAVTSMTRQLAGELGPSGIRANAVMPGAIPTEGALELVDEEGYARRVGRVPLGRLGTPEDVAEAVSFLASERSAYITGHVLAVDGGFLVT